MDYDGCQCNVRSLRGDSVGHGHVDRGDYVLRDKTDHESRILRLFHPNIPQEYKKRTLD